MSDIISEIRKRLFEFQDTEYQKFSAKLTPSVTAQSVIGVRVPQLRKLAKELFTHPDINTFLTALPHKYLEENNLHAFLIEQIKDYTLCIQRLNCFLPYIDNWATCDTLRPKCFKRHTNELLKEIYCWLKSDNTYTVRYAIGMLMTHYLDSNFKIEYADLVARIHSDKYYIKMMQAWYFATALAKQYNAVLPYIQDGKLDIWTHNKAIQKACESYRITDTQKQYLKTLKKAP